MRSHWRWTAVAVAVLLVAAAVAFADPGDRDPTYGTNGSTLYSQLNGTVFRDVVAHPLGGVVVAGRATYTTAGGGLAPLLVARFSETGAIDTTWGNQPTTLQDGADRRGSFRMVGNSTTEAYAVALDAQNRVLVAVEDAGSLSVIRLTATGQLDTTFNGDGKTAAIAVDTDIDITGFAVAPSGAIVVGLNHDVSGRRQEELYQFTAAGDPDTGFSVDGRISLLDAEVTDLFVNAANRITYARSNFGGDPAAPTRIGQIRRILANGSPDPDWNGTGSVTVPAAMQPYVMKLTYLPALTLTYVSTVSATTGGVNFRVAHYGTLGNLQDGYGGVGNGGVGTALLPGFSAPQIRGMTVLSDRKVVVAARVTPADGAPRIALTRFRDTGIRDSSWRPSDPEDVRHVTIDQLGLPGDTVVDPAGGVVRVTDDKVLVAGGADYQVGGPPDVGFLSRYGAPGDPPVVSLSRSYRAKGDPPTPGEFSRPSQLVDFNATASDVEGPIASYEWSVDNGPFQPGGPLFSTGFQNPGDHTVTVRVRDADGQDATASADVKTLENQVPEARIGAAHDTYDPGGIPATLEEDRVIVFKSLGGDPDGSVKEIKWDLDGNGSYEKTGLRTSHKYETTGNKSITLIVTDNEGRSTIEHRVLNVINPPCASTKTVSIGSRFRAIAPCWNKKVEGDLTTWTAKASPPPLPPPPPGTFQIADPLQNVTSAFAQFQIAVTSINGLRFADYDVLQIFQREGEHPQISFTGAKIIASTSMGTPFTLVDNGGDTWRLKTSQNRIDGVTLTRARYGSLDVGELASSITLPAPGRSILKFYPLLPSQLGGVTSDDLVVITAGAAVASAAAKARAAQAGLDCFKASSATVPGIEFAGEVRVCRDPSDPDFWKINVKIDLAQFGGGPFKLPEIDVEVAIRRDFVSIQGKARFGEPGQLIVNPIYLGSIDFQVVLNPKEGDVANGYDTGRVKQPRCVPGWGKVRVSNQSLRDVLVSKGVSRAQVNETIPDFEIDHGIPKMTACGGLSIFAALGDFILAEGDISIGFAQYTDNKPDGSARPNALRAIGKVKLLDNPDLRGEVALSVYSNGYSDMRAEINTVFFDLVSIDGGVRLQIKVGDQPKYNAEAWVKGCIIPLDFCSSIRAVLSNRGIGGCLGLYFLGEKWEPGATYNYNNGLELYFSGCDLGDVRVNFSGEGSTVVTAVPPPGARSSAATFRRGLPPRASITQTSKPEQTIPVRAGLPGLYVAVRGQDNQLPRFTLRGPKGERISVDGRSDGKAMEGRNLIVGHDARTGVSHVLVGGPSGGTWTVVPEPGSAPIVNVWSSEGLAPPKIDGKVTGTGRSRQLAYTLSAREGQTVRFLERGPSGNQELGRATGTQGRIRFTSAPGKAEKRQIVAIVEQDGMMREEQVVTTYKAPSTGIPSKVGRALVKRTGTRVTLRWLPAAGAKRYVVTGKLSNGRKFRAELAKRRFTVRKVPKGETGTFRIVGINEVDSPGKATTIRLKKPRSKKRR